ncbi:MAG TPA: hypothetical protein VLH13_02200 [Methanomassiliicoccales archaeon]|nr:hypothetical protein [Methanomassiliicoccales archaeon]
MKPTEAGNPAEHYPDNIFGSTGVAKMAQISIDHCGTILFISFEEKQSAPKVRPTVCSAEQHEGAQVAAYGYAFCKTRTNDIPTWIFPPLHRS